MSYLLSLTSHPVDPRPGDRTHSRQSASTGEVLRATPPTLVSGLIAELFGEANGLSREPVVFTSVTPGAGVTWTASAVAAELAAGGRKVLLAEASALASFSRDEDVCALCDRVGIDQAWVLGPEQARHREFPVSATRRRPSATLAALRQEFPYIILDAPALSQSDAALRLAPLTAGAVLVLRRAKTGAQAVVKACEQFTTIGSHVLGCVYNAH